MAMTALAISAAVGAGTAVYSATESRKSRKQAELDAAKERDSLAALQQEKEAAIPSADSDAVRRARRRSIASMTRRKGRQSTILTGDTTSGLGG